MNQFSVLVQGPLEGEGLKTFCYGLCIFTATSIVPVEPLNSVRDDKVIDFFSCLHQQEIKVELTQESQSEAHHSILYCICDLFIAALACFTVAVSSG